MAKLPAGRRIVVSIDGSDAAAAALRWAIREACLRDATLHLVCAYHYDPRIRAPYASRSEAASGDQCRASARAVLAAAEKLARCDLPPDRLTTELTEELPVRALVARAAGAEMLVLGSTRTAYGPGQPPPAVDPVARDCVRLAACPVVVVVSADQPANAGPAQRRRRGAAQVPAIGVPG